MRIQHSLLAMRKPCRLKPCSNSRKSWKPSQHTSTEHPRAVVQMPKQATPCTLSVIAEDTSICSYGCTTRFARLNLIEDKAAAKRAYSMLKRKGLWLQIPTACCVVPFICADCSVVIPFCNLIGTKSPFIVSNAAGRIFIEYNFSWFIYIRERIRTVIVFFIRVFPDPLQSAA